MYTLFTFLNDIILILNNIYKCHNTVNTNLYLLDIQIYVCGDPKLYMWGFLPLLTHLNNFNPFLKVTPCKLKNVFKTVIYPQHN